MKCTVTVTPQPFFEELRVNIQIDIAINLVLRLTDDKENLVRMMGCQLVSGSNDVTLVNLHKFAVGNYILQLRFLTGEVIQSFPLVKA